MMERIAIYLSLKLVELTALIVIPIVTGAAVNVFLHLRMIKTPGTFGYYFELWMYGVSEICIPAIAFVILSMWLSLNWRLSGKIIAKKRSKEENGGE